MSILRLKSSRITSAMLLFCFGSAFAQTAELSKPAPQPFAWTMQDSGTTASLRGIYSVDGKVAWASGAEGTILRTIDSGAHWTKCAVPPDAQALDFRGVQAWDATRALVMAAGPGDKSRVYKTDDGCKSWTLIFKNPDSPDGFFDSFFADWSDEGGTPLWIGSILGDPVHGSFRVFDTRDSGATWKPRESPDLTLKGTEVAGFAASNSLFPGNQDNDHMPQIFASGGKGGSLVWIEKSPEHTWSKIPVPITSGTDSAGIFSIASHAESVPYRNTVALQITLVAVGGDYTKPAQSAGTAAWSTDKGLHWTAATKPPHGYRSSVGYSAERELWVAAGTNGSDISTDDGKTWESLDDGNWNALSLPFVVGPKGRIARLTAIAPK